VGAHVIDQALDRAIDQVNGSGDLSQHIVAWFTKDPYRTDRHPICPARVYRCLKSC